MKTKLIILALFVSMCSNQAQEKNEVKIISLSTTHTEIIQSLGAENTLIAVDAFLKLTSQSKELTHTQSQLKN